MFLTRTFGEIILLEFPLHSLFLGRGATKTSNRSFSKSFVSDPFILKRIKEMDLFSWDGTLSYKEFAVAAAPTFVHKWERLNSSSPSWIWVHPPQSSVLSQMEGYLSLDNFCLLPSSHQESLFDANLIQNEVNEEETIDDDDATLVDFLLVEFHVLIWLPLFLFCPPYYVYPLSDLLGKVHSNKSYDGAHYYDFHIVYSASYRVPALYFRGYCCDGRPLMLNEIEKDLPSCSAKVLLESKWSFITLEEHPYMNRPWYKLHPCGTSEWMKLLFLSDALMAKNGLAIDQYLVSWFSVVGQVVGLRTPIKMVKSIHDN